MSTIGIAVDTLRYAHWTGTDAAAIAAHLDLLLTLAEGQAPTAVPDGWTLLCQRHMDGYWQPRDTAEPALYAARYSTAMADNAAAIEALTARVAALESQLPAVNG